MSLLGNCFYYKNVNLIKNKMSKVDFKQLLEAGVHFGHLKRKWNPKMAPYIFMEQNGIHIIDLYKTMAKLEEAAAAAKQIAKSGRQILFVATKKQAKEIIEEKVKPTGMPYITERWSGGMLTNFRTIRKAVKKMKAIDTMAEDGTFDKISKRERLQITRERVRENILQSTHEVCPYCQGIGILQKKSSTIHDIEDWIKRHKKEGKLRFLKLKVHPSIFHKLKEGGLKSLIVKWQFKYFLRIKLEVDESVNPRDFIFLSSKGEDLTDLYQ